jgi:hypothetical protein
MQQLSIHPASAGRKEIYFTNKKEFAIEKKKL